MQGLTKQDLQVAVDNVKNSILQRAVTKQDLEFSRDKVIGYAHDLHQQNQQLLRQANYQNAQLLRRVATLEARLMTMEHDIKITNQLLAKLADHPQPIIMPASSDSNVKGQLKYVYRPS